jgi:cell division protein FtsB
MEGTQDRNNRSEKMIDHTDMTTSSEYSVCESFGISIDAVGYDQFVQVLKERFQKEAAQYDDQLKRKEIKHKVELDSLQKRIENIDRHIELLTKQLKAEMKRLVAELGFQNNPEKNDENGSVESPANDYCPPLVIGILFTTVGLSSFFPGAFAMMKMFSSMPQKSVSELGWFFPTIMYMVVSGGVLGIGWYLMQNGIFRRKLILSSTLLSIGITVISPSLRSIELSDVTFWLGLTLIVLIISVLVIPGFRITHINLLNRRILKLHGQTHTLNDELSTLPIQHRTEINGINDRKEQLLLSQEALHSACVLGYQSGLTTNRVFEESANSRTD